MIAGRRRWTIEGRSITDSSDDEMTVVYKARLYLLLEERYRQFVEAGSQPREDFDPLSLHHCASLCSLPVIDFF